MHHEKLERKQRCVGDPPWVKLLANNSCRTGHRFWCPACLGYRSRQPSRGVKIWGKISDLPWGFTLLMDGGGGGGLPSPYIPKFSSENRNFSERLCRQHITGEQGGKICSGGISTSFPNVHLEEILGDLDRNQGLSKVQW